ncbi:MAG TPA: flagellar export protein FliJ [Aestuariivirgaceae bacterium]|nr:flagellar export protein FliJ [Aestuariivirgaceae bacterium]
MRSKSTVLKLQRFKYEDHRRQVGEIESMIAEFQRKQDELDKQVQIEEQRTGVSDPNHFNYSLTAKSIRNRRDNLNKSIADLQQQGEEARARLEESTAELHKAEALAGKSEGGSESSDAPPAGHSMIMPS